MQNFLILVYHCWSPLHLVRYVCHHKLDFLECKTTLFADATYLLIFLSESDQAFDVISSENYVSKLQNSNMLLVQVWKININKS